MKHALNFGTLTFSAFANFAYESCIWKAFSRTCISVHCSIPTQYVARDTLYNFAHI